MKVGPTGYIHSTDGFEDWGWTQDEIGRIVVFTPEYRIFQRMLNGHMLMFSRRNVSNWNALYGDELSEIRSTIEQRY